MNEKINLLPNDLAVDVLRKVVKKWIENRSLEAFVVFNKVREEYSSTYESLPAWLNEPSSQASAELVSTSKFVLDAILTGDDEKAKEWVETELDALENAEAFVADPVTIAIIGGATIIGIILAARVKKIGNVEFFEGIPPETVEIARYATDIVLPPKV